jgi:hypothetical protein
VRAAAARSDAEAGDGIVLADLDPHGVIQDGLTLFYGHSRADFLRRTILGGVSMLAVLAVPAPAAASRTLDTSILNFALTFERLQAGFYTEAERLGALSPGSARWARVIGAHERAHVKIIQSVLGRAAAKSPFFDYRGVTEDEPAFTRTAVAMEDLTTALLIGLTQQVDSRPLLAAFFSLLSVEARHAAWVRHSTNVLPIATPIDQPKSLSEVKRIVQGTHFIAKNPRIESGARPQFTG